MHTINDRLMQLRAEVPRGSIWSYVDGGAYRIMAVEFNATSYEDKHTLGIAVVYEQLHKGRFPAGQVWVRTIDDFCSETIRDGKSVRKFVRLTETPWEAANQDGD